MKIYVLRKKYQLIGLYSSLTAAKKAQNGREEFQIETWLLNPAGMQILPIWNVNLKTFNVKGPIYKLTKKNFVHGIRTNKTKEKFLSVQAASKEEALALTRTYLREYEILNIRWDDV